MKNLNMIKFFIYLFLCSNLFSQSNLQKTEHSFEQNKINPSIDLNTLNDEFNKEIKIVSSLDEELTSIENDLNGSKRINKKNPSNSESIIDQNLTKRDNDQNLDLKSQIKNSNTKLGSEPITKKFENDSQKDDINANLQLNKKIALRIKGQKSKANNESQIIVKRHLKKESNLAKYKFISKRDNKTKYEVQCLKNDIIDAIKPAELPNRACEIYTGKLNYVSSINKKKRILECVPVISKLTKTTLSVYLDNLPNSIYNSIRVEDIDFASKIYGETLNCLSLSSKEKNQKSLSLCFDNGAELKKLVGQIRDMKRCFLNFETVEYNKLVKDYGFLSFLLQAQYKLAAKIASKKSKGSVINEKLRDLYYDNNMVAVNKSVELQEQMIEKILDKLLEKSLAEEAIAKSRERQLVVSKKDCKKESKTKESSSPTTKKARAINKLKDVSVSRSDLIKNLRMESVKTNNDIILQLKKASLVLSGNICLNRNDPAIISELEFRKSVCEILKNESDLVEDCHVNNKAEFCSVCCHGQSSSESITNSCIKACLS